MLISENQCESVLYFGARYLDPKTSRWMSPDPALGDYLPVAPISDEAREKNKRLPNDGIFNYFNLAIYHYGNNNPVKYNDPNGEVPFLLVTGAIGAVVGGVAGGVIGAVKSYNETGKVDWKQVGGYAAIGASAGALIGLTAGAATAYVAAGSATASTSAVVTSISGTATATATGTITALSADGDPTNEVRDVTNIVSKGSELNKTGFFEKIFTNKAPVNSLKPNPLDEFVTVGPSDSAVSKYIKEIVRMGTIKDPIMVKKLNDGSYQIINGHHRWLAAQRTGLKEVPIKILE